MTDDSIDRQPILLRAYSTPIAPLDEKSSRDRRRGRRINPIGPETISLVLDTETTLDPAMRARLAFYQIRVGDKCDEEGLVYEPREAFPDDVETVMAYAAARGLPTPITFDALREKLFDIYQVGGQIIGFNLPFDLSRIAIGSAPCKATKWNKAYRGGHSLVLWDSEYRPRIQIKHLTPRAALHQFAAPNRGISRSARRRKDKVPVRRGTFIDVRTIAGALLADNFSLERLTEALDTPTRKIGTSAHGEPLTFAYLDYARADVQATWECHVALRDRHATFGLDTPLAMIRSEASIGKAMLDQMGVAVHPNNDPDKLARDFHAYFGGRTEIRIRRTIVPVVLTDFMSMYPTVCTLMGLWRFVIAESVVERDATEEVCDFGCRRDARILARSRPLARTHDFGAGSLRQRFIPGAQLLSGRAARLDRAQLSNLQRRVVVHARRRACSQIPVGQNARHLRGGVIRAGTAATRAQADKALGQDHHRSLSRRSVPRAGRDARARVAARKPIGCRARGIRRSAPDAQDHRQRDELWHLRPDQHA